MLRPNSEVDAIGKTRLLLKHADGFVLVLVAAVVPRRSGRSCRAQPSDCGGRRLLLESVSTTASRSKSSKGRAGAPCGRLHTFRSLYVRAHVPPAAHERARAPFPKEQRFAWRHPHLARPRCRRRRRHLSEGDAPLESQRDAAVDQPATRRRPIARRAPLRPARRDGSRVRHRAPGELPDVSQRLPLARTRRSAIRRTHAGRAPANRHQRCRVPRSFGRRLRRLPEGTRAATIRGRCSRLLHRERKR